MLTDDEIAFLRARLYEDEAAAKAATAAPWRSSPGSLYVQPEFGPITIQAVYSEDAAHIARNDPARVLREVAVWRKLLLEYHSAPHDAMYGGTERETGFRLALSAALKAKIATYDSNPVTGEPFPFQEGPAHAR